MVIRAHNKMSFRALLGVAAILCNPATAQVVMNSVTPNWTVINYPYSTPDPFDDQQTGSYEADIVGDANHGAFYTAFDGVGTPSLVDGWLAFRFRMAGEKPPKGYTGAAFVGLDANRDGALDVFVGVNNSGSKNHVGIWGAGSSANTSPGTISLDTKNPVYTAEASVSNYDWSALSETIDPDAQTLDVNQDGNTDYFLSFSVPFAEVVGACGNANITGVTEDTVIRYVAFTATQANSPNQDIGGVEGQGNSDLTWTSLGAISAVM